MFRNSIRKAIEEDPSISEKSLRQQFDRLIFRPLEALGTSYSKPLVIVLDALDACDNSGHVKLLIHLLAGAEKLEKIRLKVFLTSRPELPIRLGFKDVSGNCYQAIALHEITNSVVRSDIEIHMRHKLARIRADNPNQLAPDWPGEQKIQQLVSIADPLFISAATICRFLGDQRFNPEEQVDAVIKYQHACQADQLEATYQPVLDALILDLNRTEKARVLKEFQDVVGTIIVAADALSISSLASILGISTTLIEYRLKGLHSVLKITDDKSVPVRPFHLSFREYLIDRLHENQVFSINEPDAHRRLARACLKLLSSTTRLKQDICDLKNYSIARKDISKDAIAIHLTADIQYACRYWVYHLARGNCDLSDGDIVHKFLEERFLYWIEALCLMGRSNEVAGMIEELQQLAKVSSLMLSVDMYADLVQSNIDSPLAKFIIEVKELLNINQSILDSTPLQIYSSGLLFTPKSKNLRSSLNNVTLEAVRTLPQVFDAWDGAEQYPGHYANIYKAVVSPDGRRLASASTDSTIKLWDLETGQLQHTFHDNLNYDLQLQFLWNGTRLASSTSESTVRIWSSITGALLGTLEAQSRDVFRLDFPKMIVTCWFFAKLTCTSVSWYGRQLLLI